MKGPLLRAILSWKKGKIEYLIWIKKIGGKIYKVFVDETDTLKDIKEFMASAIKLPVI